MLTEYEGMIYMGDMLVLPEQLRSRALDDPSPSKQPAHSLHTVHLLRVMLRWRCYPMALVLAKTGRRGVLTGMLLGMFQPVSS